MCDEIYKNQKILYTFRKLQLCPLSHQGISRLGIYQISRNIKSLVSDELTVEQQIMRIKWIVITLIPDQLTYESVHIMVSIDV